MKNEASLYRAIARAAKATPGGIAHKLHDVSTGGLPDMLCVVRGVTCFIETKMNKRVTVDVAPLLTPLQKVILPQLAKGHAPVAVVAFHTRSGQYHAYRFPELSAPTVVADAPGALLDEFTRKARG